jgi:hypothetical protein
VIKLYICRTLNIEIKCTERNNIKFINMNNIKTRLSIVQIIACNLEIQLKNKHTFYRRMYKEVNNLFL